VCQKACGCAAGLMVGDSLGAGFEGMDPEEIGSICKRTWGSDVVMDYISAVHMGTYVPGENPGTYREARGVNDMMFVPCGPPSNSNTSTRCARFAQYTDDTCACLAIGMSLVQFGRADASHAAKTVAELFIKKNEAWRGCPPTAKKVMQATLEGVPVEQTGLPPIFPFDGGSFANGGAMRISLLAIAYRNAPASVLRFAVEEAIKASHRHPEAIDFAVVQASAVQYALHVKPKDFDPHVLMKHLRGICSTPSMQNVIEATEVALYSETGDGSVNTKQLKDVVNSLKRPGSGMGFQIASVHMAPCVLWASCVYHATPRQAVQAAIGLGGDTDTTASMVGAIMGALHGSEWCADWFAQLENGEHGRDFAIKLATNLADMDMHA